MALFTRRRDFLSVTTPRIDLGNAIGGTSVYFSPSNTFGRFIVTSTVDLGLTATAPDNLFVAIRNSPAQTIILKVVDVKATGYDAITSLSITFTDPVTQTSQTWTDSVADGPEIPIVEGPDGWWGSVAESSTQLGEISEGAQITLVGLPPNTPVSSTKTFYVYTLEPLDATDSLVDEAEWALEPLRFPLNKWRDGQNTVVEDFLDLENMRVSVGLPPLSTGQAYKDISRNGVNLTALDQIFSPNFLPSVITANTIGDIEAIEAGPASGSDPVTIRDLSSLIRRLYDARELLADFTEYLAQTSNTELSLEVRVLISEIEKLRPLRDTIDAALNWDTEVNAPSPDIWIELDQLLGNSITSWIPVNADNSLRTDLQTSLEQARLYIDALLFGQTGQPLISTQTQPLQGGRDSLYYLRYVYLNARMNKSTGALYQAAQLEQNWTRLRQITAASNQALEVLSGLLDALPVERFEPMDVVDGKLYLTKVRDVVREALQTCPELCVQLDIEPPQAPFLELWMKDNELDLLAYDSKDTLPPYIVERLKQSHRVYTDIVEEPEFEQPLWAVRERLARKFPQTYVVDDAGNYANELGWANGARYGSVTLTLDKNGEPVDNPNAHSWLYDAVYITDTETFIEYEKTTQQFPVTYRDISGETQEAQVTLKKPVGLVGIDEGDPELYLTCDDFDDAGDPIVIYLGKASEVRIQFDFIEEDIDRSAIINPLTPDEFSCLREEGVSISDEQDRIVAQPLLQLTAGEIAQLIVNQANEFGNRRNKYWMEDVERIVGGRIVSTAGRPRLASNLFDSTMAQALARKAEQNPANTNNIPLVANPQQPVVKTFYNFVRKMLIDISSIKWDRSGTQENILYRKHQLPFMRTNVRIAIKYV